MDLNYCLIAILFAAVFTAAASHSVQPFIQRMAKVLRLKLVFALFLLPVVCQSQVRNVGFVKASDPDFNQVLKYCITAGNSAGYFTIDPLSGMLTVKLNVYDTFVRQRTFKLTVKVTDDGKIYNADGTIRQEKPLIKKAVITVILKKTASSSGIIYESEINYV